jgi:DNA-binding response OmpR family regulator
MRALLVEPDARVAEEIRSALTLRGAVLTWLRTQDNAVAFARAVDVVLLDLDLPETDGLKLCGEIGARTDAGIIAFSVHREVSARIRGLDAGADDYLFKPFDIGELVARMHAVLRRRGRWRTPARIRAQDVEIDIPRHQVYVAGKPVTLTRKEFQLIALLAAARGEVCHRERLIAEIWGEATPSANRSLDVHIGTLRTKLNRPEVVVTVRGIGYRISG